MKKFIDTYELDSWAKVGLIKDRVVYVHGLMQKLEAGEDVEAPPAQKARATFEFLKLMGFYPTEVDVAGKMKVIITALHTHKVFDEVCVRLWTDAAMFVETPLLGPDAPDDTVMLTMDMFDELIDVSWPEIDTYTSEGDEPRIWQVSIREAGYSDTPLASGAAMCSNEVVAHIQAYLRMLEHWLVKKQAKLLIAEKFPLPQYTKTHWTPGAQQQWRDRLSTSLRPPRQHGKTMQGISTFLQAQVERRAAISYLESVQNGDAVSFDKLKIRYFGQRVLKEVFQKSADDIRKNLLHVGMPGVIVKAFITEYEKKVFGKPLLPGG